VDLLVQQAIAAGLARFDFLKGDEAYKFRLGGRPRALFVVEGVR
jgi:CelD/BcsL family acetyltransferase involved in cellulose biosynthesis